MVKYFILFLLFISTLSPAQAIDQYFCQKDFESLPVLAGGRVKPLYVLATEELDFMTGKTKLENLDPVMAFCLLSIENTGLSNELEVPIRVDHLESKKLLGLDQDAHTIPAIELLKKEELVREKIMLEKMNTPLKKDLNKVWSRLQSYKAITNGEAWTFYNKNSQKEEKWEPLAVFLTEDKVSPLKNRGEDAIASLFYQTKADYIAAHGDDYLVELSFEKANLFKWAILLVIAAIFVGTISKKLLPLSIISLIVVLVEAIGIAVRVYISGRAPITNMYETVMFSGFGALVISIIISSYRKEKTFILAGLIYNLLCLFMLNFADGMLSSSISPLQPVLRDNFWLSTHVTTVILSYAALALSWVLANIVLYKQSFKKISASDLRYETDLIYTCIKYGVVLLSAGVILGGVWADYSWGRFWGWDPKETWSLIVLLIYMAILHGKYTNWITPRVFVPLVAAAFLSVMMAWFGVNYILASGLHSYGFSEGGAIFLGSFFAVQIAFLIFSWIKTFRLKTGD